MDEGRNSPHGSENKKNNDDAQGLTSNKTLIVNMCQEKEEEDSPILKIAWTYQYKDSKTK